MPESWTARWPDERLALIFTCCHPALAPEARVALALGRSAASRPRRLRTPSRPRADDGPAPRSREAEDQRRPHPYEVPPRQAIPSGSTPCSPSSTSSSTRATARAPDRRSRAPIWSANPPAGARARGAPAGRGRGARALALLELQSSRTATPPTPRAGSPARGPGPRSVGSRRDRARARRRSPRARRCADPRVRTRSRPRSRRAMRAPRRGMRPIGGHRRTLRRAPQVAHRPSALHRAVAIAMDGGPAAALALVDALYDEPRLRAYHLLPATRADLLRRLGRVRGRARGVRAGRDLSGERERARLPRTSHSPSAPPSWRSSADEDRPRHVARRTRKGAFVLESDANANASHSPPRVPRHIVNHVVLDPRDGRTIVVRGAHRAPRTTRSPLRRSRALVAGGSRPPRLREGGRRAHGARLRARVLARAGP